MKANTLASSLLALTLLPFFTLADFAIMQTTDPKGQWPVLRIDDWNCEDLYSHGQIIDGGSPGDDIFHIGQGNLCGPFLTDYYKRADGHYDGYQSGGDGIAHASCTFVGGPHGGQTLTCGSGTYQEVMYCTTDDGWC